MISRQHQFKLWKNKQKSYNDLYYFTIKLYNRSLPWNNHTLNFQQRFKLWKKYYRSYLITKEKFALELNNSIFRDNNTLNYLEALELLNSIKN